MEALALCLDDKGFLLLQRVITSINARTKVASLGHRSKLSSWSASACTGFEVHNMLDVII